MNSHTSIRISDPGELLASIPALMGFTPSESLVLISLRGSRAGLVVRADLPPRDRRELARQMAAAALTADDIEVVAAIIDDGEYLGLIDELRQSGITLVETYQVAEIVAGARWYNPLNPSVHGRLPDPKSTALRTAKALQGIVVYDSRDAIEALFHADNDEAIERRETLIDELRGASWSTQRCANIVRTALRRSLQHDPQPLADTDIAELGNSLADTTVRDACLATALPADSPVAAAAIGLWQALTRGLPAPERAEAAVLAGFASYMMRDGTAARIALCAAQCASPGHVLSGLLLRALDHGVPPERLRECATHDDIGLCESLHADD